MKKIIDLQPENFKLIRKQYFKFTLEFVSKHTKLSIPTIRHAEMGLSVSPATIDTLSNFYKYCYKIKEKVKEQKNAKHNNNRIQ